MSSTQTKLLSKRFEFLPTNPFSMSSISLNDKFNNGAKNTDSQSDSGNNNLKSSFFNSVNDLNQNDDEKRYSSESEHGNEEIEEGEIEDEDIHMSTDIYSNSNDSSQASSSHKRKHKHRDKKKRKAKRSKKSNTNINDTFIDLNDNEIENTTKQSKKLQLEPLMSQQELSKWSTIKQSHIGCETINKNISFQIQKPIRQQSNLEIQQSQPQPQPQPQQQQQKSLFQLLNTTTTGQTISFIDPTITEKENNKPLIKPIQSLTKILTTTNKQKEKFKRKSIDNISGNENRNKTKQNLDIDSDLNRSKNCSKKQQKKRKYIEAMKEKEKRAEEWKDKCSETVCRYYLDNRCTKGDQCPYSHIIPSHMKKSEICKFYLNGYCAKADKCIYMHSEFPCKFFHLKKRQCQHITGCRFSHEPLNDYTRDALEKYLKECGEDDDAREIASNKILSNEISSSSINNQIPSLMCMNINTYPQAQSDIPPLQSKSPPLSSLLPLPLVNDVGILAQNSILFSQDIDERCPIPIQVSQSKSIATSTITQNSIIKSVDISLPLPILPTLPKPLLPPPPLPPIIPIPSVITKIPTSNSQLQQIKTLEEQISDIDERQQLSLDAQKNQQQEAQKLITNLLDSNLNASDLLLKLIHTKQNNNVDANTGLLSTLITTLASSIPPPSIKTKNDSNTTQFTKSNQSPLLINEDEPPLKLFLPKLKQHDDLINFKINDEDRDLLIDARTNGRLAYNPVRIDIEPSKLWFNKNLKNTTLPDDEQDCDPRIAFYSDINNYKPNKELNDIEINMTNNTNNTITNTQINKIEQQRNNNNNNNNTKQESNDFSVFINNASTLTTTTTTMLSQPQQQPQLLPQQQQQQQSNDLLELINQRSNKNSLLSSLPDLKLPTNNDKNMQSFYSSTSTTSTFSETSVFKLSIEDYKRRLRAIKPDDNIIDDSRTHLNDSIFNQDIVKNEKQNQPPTIPSYAVDNLTFGISGIKPPQSLHELLKNFPS